MSARLAIVALAVCLAGCTADTRPVTPSPLKAPTPVRAPERNPPAIPFPLGAPASETTLTFNSDPGDFIGAGTWRTYYLGDGSWTARYDTNGGKGHVHVRFTSASSWWDLDLAARSGQPLTPGTYDNAGGYPFQGDARPGLQFSGWGRGCGGASTGRFLISELSIGPENTVDRLKALFEQHCDGKSSLRGSVVIASDPWR